MRRPLRSGLLIAGTLIAIALVVVVLFWVFQRSLIYLPNENEVRPAEDVHPGGEDLTLHTEDGLELSAWLLGPDPSADRETAVLYAPGNAGNRESRLGIARRLTDRGFTVLLLEYRGYGGNPGRPTEEGLAKDAVAATEALTEQGFPPERTLYVGESLGTGVVAALQSTHPPAGVLLRSPFPEFADMAREHFGFLPVEMMLYDEFPVTEYLSNSAVPVTVMYGSADTTVPPELSIEVADAAGVLHQQIALDGVDHNDPEMFSIDVVDAVEDLADEVAP